MVPVWFITAYSVEEIKRTVKRTKTVVGKNVEKWKPSYITGGSVN
jgi:hypothetical protein